MSNSIDKALGVVESLPLKIPPQEIVNKVPDELVGDEVDADYKYQRENFYGLVECYILAIPFLANTIISTIFFSYAALIASNFAFKKITQ